MIIYTCDRCGRTTEDQRLVWLPEFKQMKQEGQFPVAKRDSIWHVCARCVESFYQRLPQPTLTPESTETKLPTHSLDSRCTVQGCPECDHAPNRKDDCG